MCSLTGSYQVRVCGAANQVVKLNRASRCLSWPNTTPSFYHCPDSYGSFVLAFLYNFVLNYVSINNVILCFLFLSLCTCSHIIVVFCVCCVCVCIWLLFTIPFLISIHVVTASHSLLLFIAMWNPIVQLYCNLFICLLWLDIYVICNFCPLWPMLSLTFSFLSYTQVAHAHLVLQEKVENSLFCSLPNKALWRKKIGSSKFSG
jgi:hypothetical protein